MSISMTGLAGIIIIAASFIIELTNKDFDEEQVFGEEES